jgi:hypothetical protein
LQKALPPATVKYDIVSPFDFYRLDYVDNPTCNIRDIYFYEHSENSSVQKRKLATLTSAGIYLFPFGNQIKKDRLNQILAGLPIAFRLQLNAVSLKPKHFLVFGFRGTQKMLNNLSTPMFISNDDYEGGSIESLSFEFNLNKKLWIEKVFAFYLLRGRPYNDTIRDLALGLGFDAWEINPALSAKSMLSKFLQNISEEEKKRIKQSIYKFHVTAKISIKKNGRLKLDGIHFTSQVAQKRIAGSRKMNVQKESNEILNFCEHQFCKDDEGLVLIIPLSTLRICWDYFVEADSLKLASEIGELENKILS